MTGGVVHWITGAGPYGLLNVNQIFYVVAVVATYWAARSIMNRNWSLVAALMVATVPGLVESSRGFSMAVASTATLTAALAVQVHTRSLQIVVADPFVGWSPGTGCSVAHDRSGLLAGSRPGRCRSRSLRPGRRAGSSSTSSPVCRWAY